MIQFSWPIWHVYAWIFFLITLIVGALMTVGGFRDLRALFITLETADRNAADDGSVPDVLDSESAAVAIEGEEA